MILGVSTAPHAAEKFDIGKREYEASRAVCNGQNGMGGGSFAGLLQLRMPEEFVCARILAVIEYLYRLQVR